MSRTEGSDTGSPVVLVMDDDEDVRLICGWYLKKLGFCVEFVDDGEMLLRRLRQGGEVCAMIVDLNIPGRMGGREVIRLVREIDPDAIVIVSSGSDDDPAMVDPREHGFSGKLLKPFTLEECQRLFSSLGILPTQKF